MTSVKNGIIIKDDENNDVTLQLKNAQLLKFKVN